ncbi:MAG: cell division protein FtsL [Oscillospiraceae bacterium]|nr:cell division protein FtsL [Oscillospiraceae bacterium]
MKNASSEYDYSSVKQKTQKRQVSSYKFRLSVSIVLTALLAAAVACLMIKTLFVRIELTKQNDINVELEAQLSMLEEEKRRLMIEYESHIDLGDLEKIAENELGMQKPDASQIRKIDTDTQDKALIIAKG